MAKNTILGSISRVLDPAPPASVAEIMPRCISGTQREAASVIIKDWRAEKKLRDDWVFPARRPSVVLAFHGVASLDDLDREASLTAQKAAYEHRPHEVLRYDAWLSERMQRCAERAKSVIVDLNRTMAGHIETEIEKAEAFLRPLYQTHGCEHAIADAEPIRRLRAALERTEAAARGEFSTGEWDVERSLSEWL
jgi:hypothetical protein